MTEVHELREQFKDEILPKLPQLGLRGLAKGKREEILARTCEWRKGVIASFGRPPADEHLLKSLKKCDHLLRKYAGY